MTVEIEQLWLLRGLDEEVAQIRTALARYPGVKSDLARRVEADKVRLESQKKTLGDLQLRRRELEREIEAVTQQERKFLAQQPSVKTNAEYQALTHEITACRAKRSDLETQVLVLLEDEEKIAGERPAIEKSLAAAEAERAERLRAIETEERALEERAAAREAERQEAMGKLPPATRARYERVNASRGGQAVVAIVKGACGGCFRAQPPQLMQEARRRDRLLTCEGCGRLLIYPPEGAVV